MGPSRYSDHPSDLDHLELSGCQDDPPATWFSYCSDDPRSSQAPSLALDEHEDPVQSTFFSFFAWPDDVMDGAHASAGRCTNRPLDRWLFSSSHLAIIRRFHSSAPTSTPVHATMRSDLSRIHKVLPG